MRRHMNKLTTGLTIVLMLSISALSMPSTSIAQEKTLYQRLGGYDAISAVVNEFANRLFADKKIERFFGTLSNDTREKFKQHNTSLVCAATGGPCTYLGRSMTTSHQGMKVSETDFNVVAGHLAATLDKFKVPATEKNELLGIIGSMKGQIVE
jgi:hemoglobin